MEIGGAFAIQETNPPQTDTIFHRLSAYETVYTDSGRSAARLLSAVLPQGPVLLPAYICASVCSCFPDRPLRFFRLTETLQFDWDDLFRQLDGSAVLYLHYFNGALPEEARLRQLREEAQRRGIVIVEDSTHSIFSAPLTIGDYGVCSLRKWFPIPDGGVLYGNHLPAIPQPVQEDAPRCHEVQQAMEWKARYLRGGEPESCNLAYRAAFIAGEHALDSQQLCFRLSPFSRAVLEGCSVSAIAAARRENYATLWHLLSTLPNLRPVGIPGERDCPFFFPVRLKNGEKVRTNLQSEKVYCPIHWPMEGVLAENWESVQYSREELSLPIDQRYGKADMQRLASALCKTME